MRYKLALLCTAFLIPVASSTPALSIDTVVSLTVPRARIPGTGTGSVIQRFILLDLGDISALDIENPIEAKGVLVLFPGAAGRLGIGDGELGIGQANLLVRTRHYFAAQGFHVAVMDAATDFLTRPNQEGLGDDRTSTQHMQDIAVVINHLRGRFPGLPIWVVGTSRGSISAANAAAVLTGSAAPDGLVLISSVTRRTGPNNDRESLDDVPLHNIGVPSLVAAHKDDACRGSPPEDAVPLFQVLKKRDNRSRIRFFEGGFAPLDEACDPLSPHGFFGIEAEVVRHIGSHVRTVISGESP
ncbi:MAG: hypothetical protein HY694_04450 [Deltaproteobacteria bacterium]|nr:hypothetical protein [Deltaproteobacteria bacterium]